MQTIGAFEAKTHFSALLEAVEKGDEVVITKHGRPVAKLIAAVPVHPEAKGNAIDALKIFSKRHRLGNLNWKDLRDEGRRCL